MKQIQHQFKKKVLLYMKFFKSKNKETKSLKP